MLSTSVSRPGVFSHPVILQLPGGCDAAHWQAMQASLELALAQPSDAIVIDLHQVGAIAPEGMAVLKVAIQRAVALGKTLHFHTTDATLQIELKTEWSRQWFAHSGTWSVRCDARFSAFLSQPASLPTVPQAQHPLPQQPSLPKSSAPVLDSRLYPVSVAASVAA